MKKVLLLSGLFMTLGLFTMAQQHHPKKDSTAPKPAHVKAPKKATDTTHTTHKKH
ncbi:hypothetical protein [Niastella vici]|uniref:hypothetical protein n=1 Tax=Niastella vici TaxID=1703345 RepID=UPI001301ED22|nr:hypothetical protein [Niastella vici]